MQQISKGGFRTLQPERLTVADFLINEWLPTQRPPTLEESTYTSYARYVRLHVVPYVGGVLLQRLTPMDLNAMYRTLLDTGRRPAQPPKRQHDPAMIELVAKLRADGFTWQHVADAVADSRYLPPWVFLATTGCRRGESLGLKWEDLDLDQASAVISRQVTLVDHQIRIKELPKTKRGHLIRLDAGTVEMLRRWRALQNEERLFLGAAYRDDGFVFCKADGTVYHPERFSREFVHNQVALNRAEPDRALSELKLHGLRHTWATLALAEGIDIHIVSERLNHSSTHITREIYTHVTPPMQSDAAERVASQIFRP